ncbi:MAG TPA: polymer-forming cytoskeletal protein [Anaeromyxobacter sp.]|nr:polymer-forming cytoskeletal protein [Anaeromyxobacter sp.]
MALIPRDETPARTPNAGPATPPPTPSTSDLLLGEGAEFEGKLQFRGVVRIDARFKGSIITDDVLVVGEHARIDADITCGTVIVHGEVHGNIRAKTAVELLNTARVRGDVESPSVRVDKGASLNGAVNMSGARGAKA